MNKAEKQGDINLYLHDCDGKPNSIEIRTGDAAPAVVPQEVLLVGNIYAPSEYVKKRKDVIPVKDTHVLYLRKQGKIQLVVNEMSPYAAMVTGSLDLHPVLKDLKINVDQWYTPKDLAQALRLKGRFFTSRERHAQLMIALRNFNAQIQQEIKQEDNRQGNKLDSRQTTLQNPVSYDFSLTLPIFSGMAPSEFVIHSEVEADAGVVKIFLVSEELEEKKAYHLDAVFNQLKDDFADYVIIED